MFWAWEKHQAVKESLREEGRQEGRQAGRLEGRKENRAAMQAHLERVSRERGIPLAELLPPQSEE